MTGDVVQLPLAIDASKTAFDAFDQARLDLEELYANPATTRDERFAKAVEVRRLWQRWADIYDRGIA